MIPAFLLALREGLEAALILGIAIGVLHRVGRPEQDRIVRLGAGLAALVSLGAAIGLYVMGISFDGQAEEIFEGVAMLLAITINPLPRSSV
jgi:high-affinity iron transporter